MDEISKPKTKRLTAHAFKAMLKSKRANKVKKPDLSIPETKKLLQTEVNGSELNHSNQDGTENAGRSFSDPKQPKLDFLLIQVSDSDQAEGSPSPDHSAQNKKRKKFWEDECNLETCKQKQKLEYSVGNECKSMESGFVEYWVPVQLSNIQIEQYCSSLLSNAWSLCSSARQGLSELFGDILVSIRKCCDHPYLVDFSLRNTLIQGLPEPDWLDAEIKLSNKLLLLYKILEVIRNRGLRVLILYKLHHEDSGLISNGGILDDLIDKKFGKDSLEWISEKMSSSKRQERLKIFNEKRNEKFVCLMETGACIRSMELVSTDCVIIFNSDLDASNDLRSLQKVKLDSQFKQVKVFRLYSSHTVEEKVLILAKQSIHRRGNMISMTNSAYHDYLSWGALYLFKRLDEFHSLSTDDIHSLFSSENSFVEDVLLEVSAMLPNHDETELCSKCSFVTEVQHIEGHYRGNVSLVGEVESSLMENFSSFEQLLAKRPRDFWKKLLEDRGPRWKYISSPRTRRAKLQQNRAAKITLMGLQSRVAMEPDVEDSIEPLEFSDEHSLRETPAQTASIAAKVPRQTEAVESISIGSQSPDDQIALDSKASLNCKSPEVSQIADMAILQSDYEQLQVELEGLQKQQDDLLKVHKDKKAQLNLECEKAIEEIRKRYDTLHQNADMAFLEVNRDLETRYNRTHKTKSLFQIMMKSAVAEDKASSPVTTDSILEEPGSSIETTPGQIPRNPPNIASTANQTSAISCVTNSRNLPTGDCIMRAPAPHLRQMVHRAPVTTTQTSIPDERVIFSPVDIPKVASTAQNQHPARSASKLMKI